MKVHELRDILEDAEDDAEVRLVSQPDRHALEYRIDGIRSDAYLFTNSCPEGAVMLFEGSQVGYWSEPDTT